MKQQHAITRVTALALALMALLEPAAARGLSFSTKDMKTDQALWRLYHRWGKHYGVVRKPTESQHRFRAFNITVHQVAEAGQSATGLNSFADTTEEEFQRDYSCNLTPPPNDLTVQPVRGLRGSGSGNGTLSSPPSLAASVDWRDKTCRGLPCLGPVRNQVGCGACWAFAATGAMQAINNIEADTYLERDIAMLPPLSVQELVDCDRQSHGCAGGHAVKAFRYTIDHGLSSATAYPYTARDGTCRATSIRHVLYSIRGYDAVQRSDVLDEEPLCWAVNYGPVVIQLAFGESLRNYGGGVYSGKCGNKINHQMLLVGYNPDCYIIQNSWGTGWGESGYLLLSRDVDCGILSAKSYYPLMN